MPHLLAEGFAQLRRRFYFYRLAAFAINGVVIRRFLTLIMMLAFLMKSEARNT